MSSLEVVEAESVSYTFSASKEGSLDRALEVGMKNGAEETVYMVEAPLGVGTATHGVGTDVDFEDSFKFDCTATWSSDTSVGASRAGDFSGGRPQHHEDQE